VDNHATEIFSFHLSIAMASMKRVVFVLNTKVKVVEASEKDKLSVKEIMTEFRDGKTRTY
jgi:hypothetical protein